MNEQIVVPVKKELRRPTTGVGVFVFWQRFLLLGKRGPASRRGAGCWALPGGMCDVGETHKEAAIREVREETDLIVNPKGVEFVAVTDHLRDDIGPEDHLSFWLLCKLRQDTPPVPRVMEPGKCEMWRWFSDDELLDIPHAEDPEHQQNYWTPLALWRTWHQVTMNIGALKRS